MINNNNINNKGFIIKFYSSLSTARMAESYGANASKRRDSSLSPCQGIFLQKILTYTY